MGKILAKIQLSTRLYLFILIGLLVSACVQPLDPTPTPDTSAPPPASTVPNTAPTQESNPTAGAGTQAPAPTSAPAAANFPAQAITAWLLQQQYSPVVDNLTIFMEQTQGPDAIVGFVFANENSIRCAGFIQATAATQQIWMGDIRCSTGGAPIIAGSALFNLTSGQTYVAAYGHIDPNKVPNANAIAVEFTDGSSANQILSNFGFVILKPGLNFPTTGTLIYPGGNTITNVLFQ